MNKQNEQNIKFLVDLFIDRIDGEEMELNDLIDGNADDIKSEIEYITASQFDENEWETAKKIAYKKLNNENEQPIECQNCKVTPGCGISCTDCGHYSKRQAYIQDLLN
jgi:radical SAM protein with 4Fe4S-binding SPASM domain